MNEENKKPLPEKKESFREKPREIPNLREGKEPSQKNQSGSTRDYQQIRNPPISTKPKEEK